MANKKLFEQYLNSAPTQIFRSDIQVTNTANPYIHSLHILTDQIKEFNAKFIRYKSGLRLSGVLQFILKIVKYAPFEGRGWQPLRLLESSVSAYCSVANSSRDKIQKSSGTSPSRKIGISTSGAEIWFKLYSFA